MTTIPIIPPSLLTPNSRPSSLLKNIKNIPVSNSKKLNNKLFVTVSNNNNSNQSIKKNNGQFLQVTPYSLSVPKEVEEVEEAEENEELVGRHIQSSPSMEDLNSSINNNSNVDDSDVVPAPSASPVRRKNDNGQPITYSIEFMLSLRYNVVVVSQRRPSELDFIDQSQRDASLFQSSTSSVYSSIGSRTPLFTNNGTTSTLMYGYSITSPYKSVGAPISNPFELGTLSPFSQSFDSCLANGIGNGIIPMQLRNQPLALPINNNININVPLPIPLPTPNNIKSSFNKKQQQPLNKPIVDNKRVREEGLSNLVELQDSTDQLVKGMKKVLKEDNVKRLATRQHQIDIGKSTAGYQQYIATISKCKRKKSDPKTPTKTQICSKRSWDGQIRKWRRLLHQYDPNGSSSNLEEDEDIILDGDDDDNEDTLIHTITTTTEAIPQITSVYDSITPDMLA